MFREEPIYFHFRTGNEKNIGNMGGLTVCAMANNDDNNIVLGIAICNNKDNFNKKIGRDLALSRIPCRKHIIENYGDNVNNVQELYEEIERVAFDTWRSASDMIKSTPIFKWAKCDKILPSMVTVESSAGPLVLMRVTDSGDFPVHSGDLEHI